MIQGHTINQGVAISEGEAHLQQLERKDGRSETNERTDGGIDYCLQISRRILKSGIF